MKNKQEMNNNYVLKKNTRILVYIGTYIYGYMYT